jgi:diadenosine tetraphosphatase ApaH/serine/threonine PP2A family protein phosphatase
MDELYVHGSPADPLNAWLFPEDINNQEKMAHLGREFVGVCFNGHTHRPGLFVENGHGQWQFVTPHECSAGFRLDHRKVICNVGSVGQPRDGDWRAGYVRFDGTTIHFVRLEYDIEKTIKQIHAEPALDNFSGDRLRDGR